MIKLFGWSASRKSQISLWMQNQRQGAKDEPIKRRTITKSSGLKQIATCGVHSSPSMYYTILSQHTIESISSRMQLGNINRDTCKKNLKNMSPNTKKWTRASDCQSSFCSGNHVPTGRDRNRYFQLTESWKSLTLLKTCTGPARPQRVNIKSRKSEECLEDKSTQTFEQNWWIVFHNSVEHDFV